MEAAEPWINGEGKGELRLASVEGLLGLGSAGVALFVAVSASAGADTYWRSLPGMAHVALQLGLAAGTIVAADRLGSLLRSWPREILLAMHPLFVVALAKTVAAACDTELPLAIALGLGVLAGLPVAFMARSIAPPMVVVTLGVLGLVVSLFPWSGWSETSLVVATFSMGLLFLARACAWARHPPGAAALRALAIGLASPALALAATRWRGPPAYSVAPAPDLNSLWVACAGASALAGVAWLHPIVDVPVVTAAAAAGALVLGPPFLSSIPHWLLGPTSWALQLVFGVAVCAATAERARTGATVAAALGLMGFAWMEASLVPAQPIVPGSLMLAIGVTALLTMLAWRARRLPVRHPTAPAAR